jgi:hypothetical protein
MLYQMHVALLYLWDNTADGEDAVAECVEFGVLSSLFENAR